MIDRPQTDADRYPTLTPDGERMLRFLREHPHAPIYRNESGNRLNTQDVERVRDFEREVLAARVGWKPGAPPPWVREFAERGIADVPFYRRYGSAPARFEDLPVISRADLSRDIAQFVPDSIPVDRLINYRTSGTTGHPLLLASDPVVSASYLSFHKRALRRFGIELTHGRGQVGVVLIGCQRKCFTYVSVTPVMDESGLAKINLHPNDWHAPEDRAAYLEALAPEVLTGDPISFAALLELEVSLRPRALFSTSMALLPGLRARLENRFQCPVLDFYSMNEAGPIAVADPAVGGYVLLQHRLYVEILDPSGQPLPPGQRGEVTLTGGFNFCLPLIRYRTGDEAALDFSGPEPILKGLQGRPPVRFRIQGGEWVNNIEVTHLLGRFPIAQFTLHQRSDGSVLMKICGAASDRRAIRNALQSLFGAEAMIEIEEAGPLDEKLIQYTSDLIGSRP